MSTDRTFAAVTIAALAASNLVTSLVGYYYYRRSGIFEENLRLLIEGHIQEPEVAPEPETAVEPETVVEPEPEAPIPPVNSVAYVDDYEGRDGTVDDPDVLWSESFGGTPEAKLSH